MAGKSRYVCSLPQPEPKSSKLLKTTDKRRIFAAAKVKKTNQQKIYINDDLTKLQQSEQNLLRQHLKSLKLIDNSLYGSIRGNSLMIKKNGNITQRFKIINGSVTSY